MIELRVGRIDRVGPRRNGCIAAWAEVDGRLRRVLAYEALTGPLRPGDRVALNVTAVELGLGTGGFDFVMAVEGRSRRRRGGGHIMKNRYTPSQVCVSAVEEEGGPHRAALDSFQGLAGLPVVVASLHSMIAPVALAFKAGAPGSRVVYIMTDGGALPASFSWLLADLRERGWIDAVITCGHAFGGDYEAVTVYSALAAAESVARADLAIVAMGPGVVGTGARWGSTALEQGPLLDAAGALGGAAIAAVRIGLADGRPRHRGLSHHSATALGVLAQRRCTVALPRLPGTWTETVRKQAEEAGLFKRHRVVWHEADFIVELLERKGLAVRTMGKSPRQEPGPFLAGAAAARAALEAAASRPGRRTPPERGGGEG